VFDEVSALGDQHFLNGIGMIDQEDPMVAKAKPDNVTVLARAALDELQLVTAVVWDVAEKEMTFGTGR
jgi:hypothetical protein